MVEKLSEPVNVPAPAPIVLGLPYLYIEGFGPSSPTIETGSRHVFIYEPALRVHVRRFASAEEFAKEAPEIIKHERSWRIFPGVELTPAGDAAVADGLPAENARIVAVIENERDAARDEIKRLAAELQSFELAAKFDPASLSDLEKIAFVCHEVNRAYCRTLGDQSQKPWNEAEPWQRESAIKGVEFRLAHLSAPPSAQHDAWTADKLADGWKFGPVKDAEKKEHPCLVPFDQLPAEQQAKDFLFGYVVHAMSHRLLPAPGDSPVNSARPETPPSGEGGKALEPAQGTGMTVSQAGATLGNGKPEEADHQAGKVLAGAKEKTGKQKDPAKAKTAKSKKAK
jgi:hypothetical protein